MSLLEKQLRAKRIADFRAVRRAVANFDSATSNENYDIGANSMSTQLASIKSATSMPKEEKPVPDENEEYNKQVRSYREYKKRKKDKEKSKGKNKVILPEKLKNALKREKAINTDDISPKI